MELLKRRYYTVFDLLDNAYLTGKNGIMRFFQ